MNKRFVVGAGSQGRVVVEVWRAAEPDAQFVFLDDDPQLFGQVIAGAKVGGRVDSLGEVGGPAILAIGNNPVRLALADLWNGKVTWGRAIHPSAAVFPSASIGPGSVVFAGAVVNSSAKIGAHVVVNSGVVVEHDCVLQDGVSISPGACMGGRVEIGRASFISVGVTLAPRVRIGAGTVVGAGSVVVTDLPAGVLAYGVPAKVVKNLADGFDWKRLL
jgi:sugar O-acyltransferase (sialic acid O-acetyltransferase NeuD family)